jgi:CMP-N-acetylneuraminic acid synthetase
MCSSVVPRDVLAIIPARGGSKGIPRKNIRLLNGRPLIEFTCFAALQSKCITHAIVSTDCDEIATAARAAGVDVPFKRPIALAEDHSPTMGVIQHAVRWLENHGGQRFDIIVLLQPTAPLRTATHVDEAVSKLIDGDGDSVVSVTRVPAHFHPDWQFRIDGARLRPWSGGAFADIPTRRQALTPSYTRNGAIYAFRRATLETSGSIYGERCTPYVMPNDVSVNIDTEDDWRMAEVYLRRHVACQAV